MPEKWKGGKALEAMTAAYRKFKDSPEGEVLKTTAEIEASLAKQSLEQRVSDAVVASDVLNRIVAAGFDPGKHPRWPEGTPGSQGGEFRPGVTAPGAVGPLPIGGRSPKTRGYSDKGIAAPGVASTFDEAPAAGTPEWYEKAKKVSRATREGRPYTRFEKRERAQGRELTEAEIESGRTALGRKLSRGEIATGHVGGELADVSPVISNEFGAGSPVKREPETVDKHLGFASKIAGQSAGTIASREPIGGKDNPNGAILGQPRPDSNVTLHNGKLAKLQTRKDEAQSRYEQSIDQDSSGRYTQTDADVRASYSENVEAARIDLVHARENKKTAIAETGKTLIDAEQNRDTVALTTGKQYTERARAAAVAADSALREHVPNLPVDPTPRQRSAAIRAVENAGGVVPANVVEADKQARSTLTRITNNPEKHRVAQINKAELSVKEAKIANDNAYKSTDTAEKHLEWAEAAQKSINSGKGENADGVVVVPMSPSEKERASAGRALVVAENRLAKGKVKYVFPPNGTYGSDNGETYAARVERHKDPINVANLEHGTGSVVLSLESQLKADSMMDNLRATGHGDVGVASVPSITLWHPTDKQRQAGGEGDLAWAGKTYFANHSDVKLINDSDEAGNVDVRDQSNGVRALMINTGSKKVIVASPPTEDDPDRPKPNMVRVLDRKTGKIVTAEGPANQRVITVDTSTGKPIPGKLSEWPKDKLPQRPDGTPVTNVALLKGTKTAKGTEHLKGPDDAIALGGSNVSDFTFTPRDYRPIDLVNDRDVNGHRFSDISSESGMPVLQKGADGGSIRNAEKVLRTITALDNGTGAARVSNNMLGDASVLSPKVAARAAEHLEKLGIVTKTKVSDLTAAERRKYGLGVSRAIEDEEPGRSEESDNLYVLTEHGRSLYGETIHPEQHTIGEYESGVHRVRTAAGAAFYGQPIGSVIKRDPEPDGSYALASSSGATTASAFVKWKRSKNVDMLSLEDLSAQEERVNGNRNRGNQYGV